MRLLLSLLVLLGGCAPAKDDGGADSAAAAGWAAEETLIEDIKAAPGAGGNPLDAPRYRGPAYFPVALAERTIACPNGRPPGLQAVLSDFEQQWYSKQLAGAGEPSLLAAAAQPRAPGSASLRFTMLGNFSSGVVVRIEPEGGRRRLIAKQLAGGRGPVRVAKSIERPLSRKEAARIDAELERGRIFELAPRPCDAGLDGAQWIFEAADERGYRFTQRWSPEEGPERRLGQLLMRLTGWKIGAM